MNNSGYAFYTSVCYDPTTTINATENWWGKTDSASIEALVYHQADDPDCPVVDFVPFADSAFNFDDTASCCTDRGNVDGIVGIGGPVDVADLTYLVTYLFLGGSAPPCEEEGNVDGIVGIGGPVDVADMTYLVALLFQGGDPAPPCP